MTLLRQVAIPIINDILLENEEQFTVNIQEVPDNPILLDSARTVVIKIIDDDRKLIAGYVRISLSFSLFLSTLSVRFVLSGNYCFSACLHSLPLSFSYILHSTSCNSYNALCPSVNLSTPYRIAGKFGGNYIWRFGLQTLKLNIGGI